MDMARNVHYLTKFEGFVLEVGICHRRLNGKPCLRRLVEDLRREVLLNLRRVGRTVMMAVVAMVQTFTAFLHGLWVLGTPIMVVIIMTLANPLHSGVLREILVVPMVLFWQIFTKSGCKIV